MTNSMTTDGARLRLSEKVRLRVDRRTGRCLLLYPETGLELNETGAEIVHLCDGTWTFEEMAQRLVQAHTDVSPIVIERDLRAFLKALADRSLVQSLP